MPCCLVYLRRIRSRISQPKCNFCQLSRRRKIRSIAFETPHPGSFADLDVSSTRHFIFPKNFHQHNSAFCFRFIRIRYLQSSNHTRTMTPLHRRFVLVSCSALLLAQVRFGHCRCKFPLFLRYYRYSGFSLLPSMYSILRNRR